LHCIVGGADCSQSLWLNSKYGLYLICLGTKSGWIIALTVILAVIYFAIIITVIICPVKDLAPLENKSDGSPLAKSNQKEKQDMNEAFSKGNINPPRDL
jgi:hypothetical protein